jgi:outer membrane scaffolding protein for murein synthesis (MipA/OmpV family)
MDKQDGIGGGLGGDMRRFSDSVRTFALAAPLLLAPALASAADIGGYKDSGDPGSDWAIEGIKVGGIVVVQPTYEGSDDYEVLGFPYILPQFSGGSGFFSRIDARALDDIRFTLTERDGFIAGPLAGYKFGREEDDGDLLEGLGDIDDAFVAGGFVGYRWNQLLFDVSYHHYFGDVDGYQIRFGAEIERPVSERVILTGRIGATYADENYMQVFFGVTDEQAGDSPIFTDSFDADAGFKDVHAQVGLKADLDDRWSARASLHYSHLLGDAADSPVVESEDQFTGLLGLSYRFSVSE